MMMQSLKAEKMYSSTLDCIRQTYRKDGLKGFWHGAYSNILRGIGSSLCLVFYDELKKLRSPKKT
jgi:solute carrier family 25 (adenine nucleotide translocator) protein 4/5/6/31